MNDVQAPEPGSGHPTQLLRCAYCHADSPEADLVVCPGCATRRHPACQAESPGCPTLGCAHAVRKPRSSGAPLPPRPWLRGWRLLLPIVVIGAGLFLLAAVGAGLLMYDDWSRRPVITLRNDSGRTLVNVRIHADQSHGTCEVSAATLAPGEKLQARGESTETEMCLRWVNVDGTLVLNEPSYTRRYVILGREAIFYIGRDGRFGPTR